MAPARPPSSGWQAHLSVSEAGVLPITRIQRTDTGQDEKGPYSETSFVSGVPIAHANGEALIVTVNHFLNGAKSRECVIGEKADRKGIVVATDPENDLALVVCKSKVQWQLAKLAPRDAANGEVAYVGFPENGRVRAATARVTGDGWIDVRTINGDSGGPVMQNKELVGIINTRAPTLADLSPQYLLSAGKSREKMLAEIRDLESRRWFGGFVPVSKVREFVSRSAQKLALDYPVFTQFFQ